MIKAALRYHGAKWMLADWIIGHFPKHEVYVEPFGGSAAVLMRKPRSKAEIINDRDSDIVNLFRVYRDPDLAARLRDQCRLTPFARDEFIAALDRGDIDCPVERARQVLVRAYFGHGSNSLHVKTGFRKDSNRSGSVPPQDWARWPDRIQAFTDRLSGLTIENRDWWEVCTDFDGADTLHYLDPPYHPDTRTAASKGYKFELNSGDHTQLLERIRTLRGLVVLSAYPHKDYREALSDWRVYRRQAFADGRAAREECLWINAAAAAALDAQTPRLL